MRYSKIDGIRGFTLISMVLYHLIWDLVYLFKVPLFWYHTNAAYIWQQSICWVFILLSGFCWSMGKKKFKRGMIVFLSGAAVSLITYLVMPDQQVMFGVLTLLGTCTLILIPLEKVLSRIHSYIGLILSISLFLITRNINHGFLGFEGINLVTVPKIFYKNIITTFIGFQMKGFRSTDYFSLFPWIFLFLTGYFLYRIAVKKKLLSILETEKFFIFEKIGRKSLIVYLLHQPLIYFGLNLIMN